MEYRISEAAALLGVSDDTVRRWIDSGAVDAARDASGRMVVPGAALAEHAVRLAQAPDDPVGARRSARNRFTGLVTRVQIDGVMAQVDIQAGPHRVVSLMSAEAARELELAPGSLAVGVVKATSVIVEAPGGRA